MKMKCETCKYGRTMLMMTKVLDIGEFGNTLLYDDVIEGRTCSIDKLNECIPDKPVIMNSEKDIEYRDCEYYEREE